MATASKTTTKRHYCTCSRCGKTKIVSVNNFYKSYSELYRNTHENRMTICKDCVIEMARNYIMQFGSEAKAIYELCRLFDFLYSQTAYKSALEKAQKKGKDTDGLIGIYLQQILGLQQYNGKTFKDSDAFDKKAEEDDRAIRDEAITQELVFKWGNLPDEDIVFLENTYNDWIKKTKCETNSEEVLFRELCQMQLDIRKTREAGGDVVKKVEALQKLMASANIRPLDQSATNVSDNMLTWGTIVESIEQNEPCEYFDEYKRKEYQDYMGYKKYFANWVLRPLRNLLSGSKDFNIIEDENDKENEGGTDVATE